MAYSFNWNGCSNLLSLSFQTAYWLKFNGHSNLMPLSFQMAYSLKLNGCSNLIPLTLSLKFNGHSVLVPLALQMAYSFQWNGHWCWALGGNKSTESSFCSHAALPFQHITPTLSCPIENCTYLQCSSTIKFSIFLCSKLINSLQKSFYYCKPYHSNPRVAINMTLFEFHAKKTSQNNRHPFPRWDRRTQLHTMQCYKIGHISLLMFLVALKKAGCFQVLGGGSTQGQLTWSWCTWW